MLETINKGPIAVRMYVSEKKKEELFSSMQLLTCSSDDLAVFFCEDKNGSHWVDLVWHEKEYCKMVKKQCIINWLNKLV
jgi:hypothetical protein